MAAARAAVHELNHAAEAPREPRTEVPSEVLAILPAPSQPPVFAPAPAAPAAEAATASVLDDSAAAAGEPSSEASDDEFQDSLAV